MSFANTRQRPRICFEDLHGARTAGCQVAKEKQQRGLLRHTRQIVLMHTPAFRLEAFRRVITLDILSQPQPVGSEPRDWVEAQ